MRDSSACQGAEESALGLAGWPARCSLACSGLFNSCLERQITDDRSELPAAGSRNHLHQLNLHIDASKARPQALANGPRRVAGIARRGHDEDAQTVDAILNDLRFMKRQS